LQKIECIKNASRGEFLIETKGLVSFNSCEVNFKSSVVVNIRSSVVVNFRSSVVVNFRSTDVVNFKSSVVVNIRSSVVVNFRPLQFAVSSKFLCLLLEALSLTKARLLQIVC
jgi:hypothetical protein